MSGDSSVASGSRGETSTIDPDREWAYFKNLDYNHISWYSTPDGSFEKRVARESPLDDWTGINWNKMPNQPGEYYAVNNVPEFEYEWNEDEYYRNLTPIKTNEQVSAELHEPIDKLEEKWADFESKGEEVVWTPTLASMVNTTPVQARALEYEISPYFQLNKQGFRKNWANVRIAELRPMQRVAQSNWPNLISDFFFRFQVFRWNLTARMRLRYIKFVMVGSGIALVIDHHYSRNYRRRLKWH